MMPDYLFTIFSIVALLIAIPMFATGFGNNNRVISYGLMLFSGILVVSAIVIMFYVYYR